MLRSVSANGTGKIASAGGHALRDRDRADAWLCRNEFVHDVIPSRHRGDADRLSRGAHVRGIVSKRVIAAPQLVLRPGFETPG
jgi:hypothetical protein